MIMERDTGGEVKGCGNLFHEVKANLSLPLASWLCGTWGH